LQEGCLVEESLFGKGGGLQKMEVWKRSSSVHLDYSLAVNGLLKKLL
jgi:hypothetical protein